MENDSGGFPPYFRCESCHGLFHSTEEHVEHAAACSGDLRQSRCDFVAVPKDLYLKYVLPQLQSPNKTCELTSEVSLDPSNNVCEVQVIAKNKENENTDNLLDGAQSDKVCDVTFEETSCESVINDTETPIESDHETNRPSIRDQNSGSSKRKMSKSDGAQTASDVTVPRKIVKLHNSTELATNQVVDSLTGKTRPHRTRRKAVIDYKLLNDGVDESENNNCDKRQIKKSEEIVAAQNGTKSNIKEGETDLTTHSGNGDPTQDNPTQPSREEPYTKYKKFVKIEKGYQVIYECPMCPKKTPFCGFFRRHMETFHNDGKGFECDVCHEKCANTSQFKLHMNRHWKPFLCEMCSSTFAQKKDLLVHLKLHSGEFSYFCDHCDYKCRQMKSLKEHMRLHDGKVLQCDQEGCEYQTIYAFSLRSHKLSKHMEKTLHQCAKCKFKTNDRGAFNRHMKIHLGIKNYKCGMCHYRGHTKHDVVRHMSVHTGEKRYQCPSCLYSTSHGSALRTHLMNHVGIRAWKCKACEFMGSQRKQLLRHASKQHPEQNAEDLVEKSDVQVKIDLSHFKTWENDAYETSEETQEVQQAESEIHEDQEAVTHLIFQDPDDPNGDQVMTIHGTTELSEDQNYTIMTIDTDNLENLESQINNEGQIMTFAEGEDVMIITETPEYQDVKVANQIETEESGTMLHSDADNVEPNIQTIAMNSESVRAGQLHT